MHRLLYISRCRLPVGDEDNVVRGIVDVSRERNRREGITGVLLYTGTSFAQALEGPERALRLLMDDIAVDNRHAEVEVVIDEPASERLFGQWSMAYSGGGSHPERLIETARWYRYYPPELRVYAAQLLELMKRRHATLAE